MSGTHGTAKQFRRLGGVDERREMSGVHLRRLGMENQVAAGTAHNVHVTLEVAGIRRQVF